VKQRRGGRSYFAWIVVGSVAAVIAAYWLVVLPSIRNARIQRQIAEELQNAHQLQLAVETMNNDHALTGDRRGIGPADMGVKSLREFVQRLVNASYLTPEQAENMHAENFALINYSSADPEGTACIVSREYVDPTYQRSEPIGGYVVLSKTSSGALYGKVAGRDTLKLPDREPRILPQE
jgi:hypothetical protein